MRLVVDTNVLVRAAVQDDAKQAEIAARVMREAEAIIISGICLCEFVWVLGRLYKFPRGDIATVVDRLVNSSNVVVDRPAVAAGLAMLKAGADFRRRSDRPRGCAGKRRYVGVVRQASCVASSRARNESAVAGELTGPTLLTAAIS